VVAAMSLPESNPSSRPPDDGAPQQPTAGELTEAVKAWLPAGYLNACPKSRKRSCKHTPSPGGYVAWHEWAEKKAETHEQVRCPVCGRWSVWVKQ
jgi:hypothetical protein